MNFRSLPLSVVAALAAWLLAACSTVAPHPVDTAPQSPAAKPADSQKAESEKDRKAEQEKKAEEKAARDKELRTKKRELEYARIGLETAAIERQVRTLTVENLLQSARIDLEKAKRELELFLKSTKPHELEEHQIQMDSQTYRAEEAKDEQAELESMYKDDEFAKKTKELVLRRGRRQVELADRSLAVARKEFEVLEQHTLPERERELRRKVETAELDLKKADLEQRKAALELDVQKRQAEDKLKDLEQDVKELEQKIAKESA
jgi:hypothetical protein